MSILSGAIGTMKKKGSASWFQYQVPNTYNTKTYWVTGVAQEVSKQWKTASSATTGTGSYTDGLANSNAMNNATHPAAYYCRGLTLGGYSWFLPAKDELAHIYTNMTASGKLLATNGSHVDKFSANNYWSSTELGGNAWMISMNNGAQDYQYPKTNSLRIRPCRKV